MKMVHGSRFFLMSGMMMLLVVPFGALSVNELSPEELARREAALTPAERAQFKDRIDELLKRVNSRPAPNPEALIKRIQMKKLLNDEEKRAKKIDSLIWQNTLLTTKTLGSGIFQVGLYNSDLIEGTLLLAETIADVELYKSLTRRRVDYIMKMLVDDADSLIEILRKTNASEARFEERMALSQGIVSRVGTNKERARAILFNPLCHYIAAKHSIITGYNPFNKATMVPLLLRWGLGQVCSYLEHKLLVPSPFQSAQEAYDTYLDKKFPELAEAQFYANEMKPDGSVVRARQTVFAASTIARFFLQPFRALRKKIGNISTQQITYLQLEWVKSMAHYAGIPVPEFITSRAMCIGLDVLAAGLEGWYYDQLNERRWTGFVIENREKLLNKIFAYRKALADTTSDDNAIKTAREDLRNFVETGHKTTSMIPGMPLFEWLASKERGHNHVENKLYWGGFTLMMIAAGRLIYNLKQSA